MSNEVSSKPVVPQPRIPKVMGILNITFGAALLLCGVCSGIYIAILPMTGKALAQLSQQTAEKNKAQLKAALDAVSEEEKTAETEQAKIDLAKKRQQLEDALDAPGIAPTMNFDKMGLTDPKLIGFFAADVSTALVLNILMLVSGVGLVRFKPFGRKLGLWVAGAKLVRLVVLYSFFIIAIVPWYSRKMAEFAVDMLQQQSAGRVAGPKAAPPLDMLIRTYAITYSLFGISMIVFGSIYPIVCLFLLSRPGARAACLASRKLEERGELW